MTSTRKPLPHLFQPLSSLLPRPLRKHWPSLRVPYLFSLFLLSLVAVKLALFTPPLASPIPPPAISSFVHPHPHPAAPHSTASAALGADHLRPAPPLVAQIHPSLLHSLERNLSHRPPLDEDVEEQVEARIRPIDEHVNNPDAEQRNVQNQNQNQPPPPPPPPEQQQQQNCLQFIVYDKPVKTGSTAVRDALLSYFATRAAEYVACTFEECNAAAERILARAEPKRNLVEHLLGQDGLIERLGEFGYYKATSIRDPKTRWQSAFRYNRAKKAKHYGIEPHVSYQEFMARMPPCSLYDFYDHQGGACGDHLEERIRKIVYRYHEIIDLYDEPAGQLHMRLLPYLHVSNKSPETEADGQFDVSRLENETRLYNALKKRRLELHGHEPLLC